MKTLFLAIQYVHPTSKFQNFLINNMTTYLSNSLSLWRKMFFRVSMMPVLGPSQGDLVFMGGGTRAHSLAMVFLDKNQKAQIPVTHPCMPEKPSSGFFMQSRGPVLCGSGPIPFFVTAQHHQSVICSTSQSCHSLNPQVLQSYIPESNLIGFSSSNLPNQKQFERKLDCILLIEGTQC